MQQAAFTAGIRRTHRQATAAAGTVLEYAGPRTVVVSAPGHGLTYVTLDHHGLMPGGVTVTPAGFQALRRMLAGTAPGQRIPSWFGGFGKPDTDLTLGPRLIDVGQVALLSDMLAEIPAAGSGPGDAQGVRRRARRLVDRLNGGFHGEQELRSLIGVGPGTTPTGDDVVVGVLAGLRLSGRTREQARLTAALWPLLARTTRASRHFLAWAMRGQFATPVRGLGDALGAGTDLAAAITRMRHWGATSGVDLMYGLAAVLTDSHASPAPLASPVLGRAS